MPTGIWHMEVSARPWSAFPCMRPHGGLGELGIVLPRKLPFLPMKGSLITMYLIKGKLASKSCGFMGRDLDGSHYSFCPISPLILSLLSSIQPTFAFLPVLSSASSGSRGNGLLCPWREEWGNLLNWPLVQEKRKP